MQPLVHAAIMKLAMQRIIARQLLHFVCDVVRAARCGLQGYLSGEMVSTIFSNMGIHGYITLEQFLDIAEVCPQVSSFPAMQEQSGLCCVVCLMMACPGHASIAHLQLGNQLMLTAGRHGSHSTAAHISSCIWAGRVCLVSL